MKKFIDVTIHLVKSSTVKDTSILFVGNILTAFLGFALILILARSLSIEDMGVFSAFTNLMLLLGTFADPGISSAIVKFVAETRKRKNFRLEKKYISAALKIQLGIFLVITLLLVVFSNLVAKNLLATEDNLLVIVLVVAVFAQIIWLFSSYVLRARRKFIYSASVDVITGCLRFVSILLLVFTSTLIVRSSTLLYALTTLIAGSFGFYFLGGIYLNIKPERTQYISLLKFSSWLGVNKISSVLASRIDIQMLALLAGATSTGLYSIPSRLIFFVTVLVSSLSAVVSPRFASFNNKELEKKYLLKILVFSLLIVGGLVFWYLLADPFITVLFGDKYHDSVPIFRLLILSIVPFVLTTPSVNAIIYSIKKPKYIGFFSIFQLILIILLNVIFIQRFGALGPTYSLLIANTLLAIYTWIIVIRYYWNTNEK